MMSGYNYFRNCAVGCSRMINRGRIWLDIPLLQSSCRAKREFTNTTKNRLRADKVYVTNQQVKEPLPGRPIMYRRADSTMFEMKMGDKRIPVYSRCSMKDNFQQQLAWCQTLKDVLMQCQVPSDEINGNSCAVSLTKLAEKDQETEGSLYTNFTLLKSELLEQLHDHIEKDLRSITNEQLLDLCRVYFKSRDTELTKRSAFVLTLKKEFERRLGDKAWSVTDLVTLSEVFGGHNTDTFQTTNNLMWLFILRSKDLVTSENICLIYTKIPKKYTVWKLVKPLEESLRKWAWALDVDEIFQILEALKKTHLEKQKHLHSVAEWALLNFIALISVLEKSSVPDHQRSRNIVTLLDYFLHFQFYDAHLHQKMMHFMTVRKYRMHPDLLSSALKYAVCGLQLDHSVQNTAQLISMTEDFLEKYGMEIPPDQLHQIFVNYCDLLHFQHITTIRAEVILTVKNYLLKRFSELSTPQILEILAIGSYYIKTLNIIFLNKVLHLETIQKVKAIEDPLLQGKALFHFSFCLHPIEAYKNWAHSSKGFILDYCCTCILPYDKWPEEVKMVSDFSLEDKLKVEWLFANIIRGEKDVKYLKDVTVPLLPFRIPFVFFTDLKGKVVPVAEASKMDRKVAVVFNQHKHSRGLHHSLVERMLYLNGYECVELSIGSKSLISLRNELERKLNYVFRNISR